VTDGDPSLPPPEPPAPQSASTSSEPRKPWWKRWWVIALAAVLVLGIIAAIAGGGGDDDGGEVEDASVSAVTADDVAAASSEPEATEPASTDAPVTTEATTTTLPPTTTTTTTTLPPPPPAPIVLEGNGNQVIPIGQPLTEAQVVVASNDGNSNFIVSSLNEGLEEIDLIVNEIGPITSRNLMNVTESEAATHFEVTAEGNWRLEIHQLSDAVDTGVVKSWDGAATFTGSGNDVLVYTGNPGILQYSNSGDSNFIVYAYSDSSDILINDIGPVEGSSRITAGPLLLDVQAAGDWALTVVPV
jgi:hypothetical protein